ncbi:SusC/RagA family TonB-linked outer membrane protein [Rufibacter glacialis]|uniref:SusC/RagA family TonB-linked outer membrane protein n=1 Tax=Rufibacter glacialis TaxID=1259555 RepID=A0A5M8QBS4_9BACT|nr:TonB-dependent receptor [Rufibacter glacialis]KAA6432330.1 TonB-dependent receptor [Rufibacter glacialis]GGK77771.1 SusC/RagA family TonB-linked outer membrane protein [Rufibacter glacialis]
MDRFYSRRMGKVLLMLMLCLLQISALAQSAVTGKVTAAGSGEGLPGVSVVVKGTTIGTATAVDGSYSIEAPANGTLVFSYIGYNSQEVAVGNRTVVNVQLATDTKALDEVVVVGYGTQKRGDITGAITSVGAEEFNKGVVVSPQQLIQGKAAGVNVTPSSGRPGGASTIRIRGGTSISAGNDPLYVVDGVPLQLSNAARQSNIGGSGGQLMIFNQEPVNPLNSINPSDIESMEILKDASATAIYGSRGANGVIIITTKKGKQGSISTSYDTYFGVSKVAKTLEVLSADEYRQFMKDNNITNFTDKGASTDWQDQIFRTAYSQNHNLSVSGGTENTLYRASVGYISQQGIIISSGIDNFTGRVNINHKALNDKLSIDLNLGGAVVEEDNAPISSALGGEGGNILKDALRFNPTYPVYDEKGNYSQINQFIINPVSYAEQIEDMRTTRRNLGNISTTYNIWGPVSVNVNLGYTYENIKGNAYVPRANPLGQGLGGLANAQASEHWSKLLETTLIFKKEINANNHIDAIGGYSYQYFVDEGYRTRVSNFVSDEFKYYNIGAASQRDAITSYQESSKLISFYGRVNYNLLDRYLVTLTVRRDGSSRFGADNKWGVFPSGSVAWRVSNESFFPKTDLVSDLKFRVSYGITGNQEIGNLLSLPTLGATSSTYNIGGNAITIVSPERYANPDLKWEETAQFNVGADFQFFKGRVYGSLDYYKKNTTDLLLSFNIPSPSVVTTQLANVGEVENKGVELALGGYVFDKTDFQWKVDLNWSANRNEVISLSNEQWSTKILQNYELSGFGFTGINSQAIIPGQPLGTFYGPKYIGTENGVEQYEDVSGNGRFSLTEDVTIIGNTQPDFTFGVTNTFNYKRFDLSFMLRGSKGNDVLNNTALDLQRKNILPGQNILRAALEDEVGYKGDVRYSSRWIEDGSFIRLDNMTLGYNFNTAKVSILKNARVYVTGQNLFLITNYSGLDPEVISSISGIGESPRGIDYMTYPRARTYMVGASITF